MAENQAVIGEDPLAWLVKETSSGSDKTSTQQDVAQAAAEQIEASDIDLVEQSFMLLADKHDQIAKAFFEHLFSHYPELRARFEGVSMSGQRIKLMAALMLLVNNLRKPTILQAYLKGLGVRHQLYGVEPEDYDKFNHSLLSVLAKTARDKWTDEMDAAWRNTLHSVTQQMMVDDTVPASESGKQKAAKADVMARALEGAVTAIMLVDQDLKITYANAAMRQLFEGNETLFQQVFPDVNSDTLTEATFDLFDTSLSQQQWLPSKSDDLPCRVEIRAGNLTLGIDISAVFDDTDKCVGYMLEWHKLTEDKSSDAEMAEVAERLVVTARKFSTRQATLEACHEEQKLTLAETIAQLDELGQMVYQNNKHAWQAEQLLHDVQAKAEDGLAEIQNSLTVLSNTDTTSSAFANVVADIDEMAFQTNLLGMNASLEAARVGEHGHGFAVIASEVRHLAERAATMMKDIKALTASCSETTPTDSDAVEVLGQPLAAMMKGLQQLSEMVSEMVVAGQKQASGIEKISNKLAQMDVLVRQNTKQLEKTMEAGESLARQEQALQQRISRHIGHDSPCSSQQAIRAASERPVIHVTYPFSEPITMHLSGGGKQDSDDE